MSPRLSPRFVRLFWLLAALIWLTVMAALVNAGFTPDYWMLRHMHGGPVPYPTGSVALFGLLSTIELLTALLIVRPWAAKRVVLRLVIAFVLLLAWTFPWAAAMMHQPPVQGMHLLWLLLLDAALLLALCGVLLVSAWRALARRAHPGSSRR